jgi:uncharacterized membrane protein (UPF0127 family)
MPLGYAYFMKCFKLALGIAFTKDLNVIGWIVEEMTPLLATHYGGR